MTDIKIYQVNLDRDKDNLAFVPYDKVTEMQSSPEINSSLYDKVYEGAVEASDIEDIYRIFNLEKPNGYKGRFLSVSDVVEVIESEDIKPGFYYCDFIGFKIVPFDPDLAKDPENKLTVVMVEPGKEAKVTEIGSSLEALQTAVGGYIEAYYPFEEEVCIVCNDEGKFNGMDPCRAVYGEDKQMMDIVFGPFFICGCGGEDFSSLTEDQIKRYTEMFKNPEHFYRIGDEIKAEPYEPTAEEPSR